MARECRVGTASSPGGPERSGGGAHRASKDARLSTGYGALTTTGRRGFAKSALGLANQVRRRVCWAATPSYVIGISTEKGVHVPTRQTFLLTSLKSCSIFVPVPRPEESAVCPVPSKPLCLPRRPFAIHRNGARGGRPGEVAQKEFFPESRRQPFDKSRFAARNGRKCKELGAVFRRFSSSRMRPGRTFEAFLKSPGARGRESGGPEAPGPTDGSPLSRG